MRVTLVLALACSTMVRQTSASYTTTGGKPCISDGECNNGRCESGKCTCNYYNTCSDCSQLCAPPELAASATWPNRCPGAGVCPIETLSSTDGGGHKSKTPVPVIVVFCVLFAAFVVFGAFKMSGHGFRKQSREEQQQPVEPPTVATPVSIVSFPQPSHVQTGPIALQTQNYGAQPQYGLGFSGRPPPRY